MSRGGAVGAHREFELDPAVHAAVAHRGRKLRRHVFDALPASSRRRRSAAARRPSRAAVRARLPRRRDRGSLKPMVRASMQPGVGGRQIAARQRRCASRAGRRRPGPGARVATAGLAGVGVDQREQIGLGAAVGGLQQAFAGERAVERLRRAWSSCRRARRSACPAASGGWRSFPGAPAPAPSAFASQRSVSAALPALAAVAARVSSSFCSARVVSSSAGSSGTIWRAASR